MTTYPTEMRYVPKRWSLDVEETGPEPVSVSLASDHAQIDFTDDDTLIDGYVSAARGLVETMTNRAIIEQTRTLRMCGFPTSDAQFFELPGGNIQSVTSFSYVDVDGATQAFADYVLDNGTTSGTARLHLQHGASWPEVQGSGLPVTIVYVAGYSSAVPKRLQVGIQMVARDLFDRRDATTVKAVSENPIYRSLLQSMRVQRVVS